jgi:hypothetical protein
MIITQLLLLTRLQITMSTGTGPCKSLGTRQSGSLRRRMRLQDKTMRDDEPCKRGDLIRPE